jgi:hypothetical protein
MIVLSLSDEYIYAYILEGEEGSPRDMAGD